MLRIVILLTSLVFIASATSVDANTTKTHRIEVTVTVAGMQETADSIRQTSQEIATLTEKLSNKEDFTEQDREHITALAAALTKNAEAVNRIADALPNQLQEIQGSAVNLIDQAATDAQKVVTTSKTELIDPMLDRIQTQVLIFIALLGLVLVGVIWFALWQVRSIVATGSETISNITQTMKSVEKVVERVNRAEDSWSSY